jgi:hypothetical protein
MLAAGRQRNYARRLAVSLSREKREEKAMAGDSAGAYLFKENRLEPYSGDWADGQAWGDFLQSQGYAEQTQLWGDYPDAYIRVHEAQPDARAEFRFIAILTLVSRPHRIFLRDLNELIRFLDWMAPVFAYHSGPEPEAGDALFGTQDVG